MSKKYDDIIRKLLTDSAETAALFLGATVEDIRDTFADIRGNLKDPESNLCEGFAGILKIDAEEFSVAAVEAFDRYKLNSENAHRMLHDFGSGNHRDIIAKRIDHLFGDLETLYYHEKHAQLESRIYADGGNYFSDAEKETYKEQVEEIEEITGMDGGQLSQERTRIEDLFEYELEIKPSAVEIESMLSDGITNEDSPDAGQSPH